MPEDLITPQLEEMLVSAPYQAPKKKVKEPKGGPRHRGPSDIVSGETVAISSHEEDEDERRRRRRKWRATPLAS